MSKKTRSHKKRTNKRIRNKTKKRIRNRTIRRNKRHTIRKRRDNFLNFSVPEKHNIQKILINQSNTQSGNMIPGLREHM